MRLEDMREQFPKMPESMKRMIEQEVTVQIGQEKENDNPKVVTYKKRKKKNMAHRMLVASMGGSVGWISKSWRHRKKSMSNIISKNRCFHCFPHRS